MTLLRDWAIRPSTGMCTDQCFTLFLSPGWRILDDQPLTALGNVLRQ